jgi:hypothetical protein
MIRWVFYSKENLTMTIVVICTAIALFLLGLITFHGLSGGSAVSPRPTSTTRPIHTELIPPTIPPTTAKTASVGPSLPIALEAVDAFLSNDIQRFERVALPAAVEAVNDTPAPPATARKVTGKAVVRLGGVAQQVDEIPTSGGMLQLVMIVSGGRWQVQAIRYAPLT